MKQKEPIEYYTVAEAQDILGYSKSTMYKLLGSGALPSFGKGRLRRIPRWAVLMPPPPQKER